MTHPPKQFWEKLQKLKQNYKILGTTTVTDYRSISDLQNVPGIYGRKAPGTKKQQSQSEMFQILRKVPATEQGLSGDKKTPYS